ncbi:MAG: citramalate synthase [Candidatus Zixiibacteriota bacterium]|nr:MAG: citramalate synthase [candidate division Zixibacteria bacterium]
MQKIFLYDTTLRDGTQGASVSFTSEEKLAICHRLDEFGVHYIEGGWPGSNPRDLHFFELAKAAQFKNAKLTAFSSTRRANTAVEKDMNLKALLDSEAPVIAMFGKSWDLHVEKALCTTLEENLAMIYESVVYFKQMGREVVYDAEQFFDGFKNNSDYALQTLMAAVDGGADFITLCDTNGGSLPSEIRDIMILVKAALDEKYGGDKPIRYGIHTHNDSGMAVANSIVAVEEGAVMVQGTINGYGERTGNADLTSIIPILKLKMGLDCVSNENLAGLTNLARYISETANMTPLNSRPFVGKNAFAHKAGVHVNAVMKEPTSYEHMDPALVGNQRRVLVSDLSGKSNIEFKAHEFGFEFSDDSLDSRRIVTEIKRLEQDGYQFDVAEGSFKVLMEKLTERFKPLFKLESLRITMEKDKDDISHVHAVLKVAVGDEIEITAADGIETVDVLDRAMRKALSKHYPEVDTIRTIDFNIRVIEGHNGKPSRSRVSIESTDKEHRWSTMGVSENVVEACWQALADSYQYKLSMERKQHTGTSRPQKVR